MNKVEFSDYVSYDIQSLYKQKPDNPTYCPMCNERLSSSGIKPSKAMQKNVDYPDFLEGSSLLLVCGDCGWWCIREHYEFVDVSCARWYGMDYLIYSLPNHSDQLPIGDHPWLRALEDDEVYRTLNKLPEDLTRHFSGGIRW